VTAKEDASVIMDGHSIRRITDKAGGGGEGGGGGGKPTATTAADAEDGRIKNLMGLLEVILRWCWAFVVKLLMVTAHLLGLVAVFDVELTITESKDENFTQHGDNCSYCSRCHGDQRYYDELDKDELEAQHDNLQERDCGHDHYNKILRTAHNDGQIFVSNKGFSEVDKSHTTICCNSNDTCNIDKDYCGCDKTCRNIANIAKSSGRLCKGYNVDTCSGIIEDNNDLPCCDIVDEWELCECSSSGDSESDDSGCSSQDDVCTVYEWCVYKQHRQK
jgi:hypothetical protein